MSSDMMSFPNDWWSFVQQYQFADKDEVYTNGSMLIPSFRVRQMVEHYFTAALGERETELQKALDFMRIWISEDAHLGESELGAAFEKAEGLHKLVAIESAIASTLGAGTCHMSFVDEYETASGEEEYLCECSECGYRRWELAHDLPLFCSKCGRKVVW